MKLVAAILLALLVVTGIILVLPMGTEVGAHGGIGSGYIQIIYRDWTIETSLVVFVTFMLVVFAACYTLFRVWSTARRFPKRWRELQEQRQLNKARHGLTHGLVRLSEGAWGQAEQLLTQHAEHSDAPILNYLAAARAAQELGSETRRDAYLNLAQQAKPENTFAVELSQARLQFDYKQPQQALATLLNLDNATRRQAPVLKLFMKVYSELQQWESLIDLLPDLRKANIINEAQSDTLECNAYTQLLARAATDQDATALLKAWQQMPQKIRAYESVISEYARGLISKGMSDQAELALHEVISKEWNEKLVHLYGLAAGLDSAKQLARAEAWLDKHENNALLLLTLGRLCLRTRLWGKARRYLEASIMATPHTEAYHTLAQLLERLGEQEKALDCYRKGLALITDKIAGQPPLPAHLPTTPRETAFAQPAVLPVR